MLDRLAVAADGATDRPPHELGARFAFDLETLHHLVTSNAVNVGGWLLLDRAVRLGATPVTDGGPGDVVVPDGGRVWIDGGPTRFTAPIDGCAVLPRVTIEHGSLRPLAAANATSADLATDQLAAVTHDGGAARIIAPAGSGKTRVLTERARHLLHSWHLPGSAVCLVAFNKRAQEEMRARSADLRGLQVRTLNAIASGDRQRHQAVRSPTGHAAHDRRGRRAPLDRRSGQLPAQAQRRPGGLVDRGAVAGPSRPARPERGRGDVRRRGRRVRRRPAALPRRARPPGRARLRRADPAGHRAAARRRRGAPRRPARLPAAAGRRVPGSHARPTSCSSACSPGPTARCSAWATTTRRSTATTAPIPAG